MSDIPRHCYFVSRSAGTEKTYMVRGTQMTGGYGVPSFHEAQLICDLLNTMVGSARLAIAESALSDFLYGLFADAEEQV